jgi:hypothetical protein
MVPTGEQTKLRILHALAAFARWSPSHAGAACPTIADLIDPHGDPHELDDPWGHAIAITCTDQPADQIIGAIAAGPDGTLGTDDDIPSWTLGKDVTSFVHGARWKVVAHRDPRPPVARPPAPAAVPAAHAAAPARATPPPPLHPADIPATRTPAASPAADIPATRTPTKPDDTDDIPRVRK